MRRFLWAGVHKDVKRVADAWLGVPGIRFLDPGCVNGQLRYLTDSGSEFWETMRRRRLVLVAGEFTVEVRVSQARLFVIENSGPLLYFAQPTTFLGEFVYDPAKPPKQPVELREGYLGIHGQYSYLVPPELKPRNPTKEAEAAYKQLIKVAKTVLVRRQGRWVGPQAAEWLDGGRAAYRSVS